MDVRCVLMMVLLAVGALASKDMTRKSIVFDKNTPDVFYCPIHKPTGMDKLIVKAKPLGKLCEFEGGPIPDDYKSDCYQDVDESSYACKEKYRIMMRLSPPGADEPPMDDRQMGQMRRLARFIDVDREYYEMKLDEKTKKSPKRRLRNRLG
ncbi:uncharacterized protein LOC109536561 isoform X1 [Dendroctonus ponderosae]|uniref:uncharacterized protein LOC109536561 isoform X1 n=1 Tax=Dendroctonus ponderosae TaxID=77166 RepID=UPI00203586D6|nr:uncharacterized protein LOC109536561 isoform X1 [Dendroctonus ponderosae]KAH1003183.1 hypothetical protein HUJ05_011123 [Dendroctonus ponderosae]